MQGTTATCFAPRRDRKIFFATIAAALAVALTAFGLVTAPSTDSTSTSEEQQRAALQETGLPVTTATTPQDAEPNPLLPGVQAVPPKPRPNPNPPGANEGWTSFSHWTRNSDGTITTRLFLHPTFHRTDRGWEPIETNITTTNDADAPAKASRALRPITFRTDASRLLSIDLDKGPVSLGTSSLSLGTPTITPTGVTFADVAPSTDLRISVSAAGIRQQLVLRSSKAPRRFAYHLSDPSGALGRLVDGAIGMRFSSRIDEDVVLGLLPAFAYEDRSTRHAYPAFEPGTASLKSDRAGDGYDITVEVDDQWLATKRFPIVVEPNIGFDDADQHIDEVYAFRGPECPTRGCVGRWAGVTAAGSYADATQSVDPIRSAYRFDLSPIPQGSAILRATFAARNTACLGVRLAGGDANCGTGGADIAVKTLDKPWTEQSRIDELDGAATKETADHEVVTSAQTTRSFDLTRQAQRWAQGVTENDGFMLASTADATKDSGGVEFASAAQPAADPQGAAMMSVSYSTTPPGYGLEDWWSYETTDIGPQAQAHVNVANGNLVVQHTDSVPVQGHGGLGYVLRRTYNSQNASAASIGGAGVGWQFTSPKLAILRARAPRWDWTRRTTARPGALPEA